MSARALLDALRARDVRLRVEDDDLRLSAPDGVLTDEMREELRAHKSEVIALLRAEQTAPEAPLSFAQESLWMAIQSGAPSAAFHLPAAYWLRGRLQPELFRSCLQAIVQRHEALRTGIVLREGRPVQRVREEVDLPLLELDLGHVDPARRRHRVRELLAADAGRAFDLEEGPLVRFGLFRLDEREHAFYVLASHLVWDGHSFGVFLDELQRRYAAAERGEPLEDAPLPLQQGEYARWQRALADAEEWREALEHRCKRLGGALPVLQMPTDRPRPEEMSWRGGSEEIVLPQATAEGVAALARRHGATPFMVLAAAYVALLRRWSGQDEVLVGYPQAGTGRPELESMIGFFVNTMVMRARVEDDPTFGELIERVRAEQLEAFAGRDVPFAHVVARLGVRREANRTPVYQTLFTLEDERRHAARIGSLDLEPFEVASGYVQTDLVLWVKERADGLKVGLDHATELFDAATARRLLEGYRQILASVIESDDRPLSTLRLMGERQAREAIALGAGAVDDPDPPSARCLQQSFEAQAARTPDAVACRDERKAATFAELDAFGNRIARRLRRVGVEPGDCVGVSLDRGVPLFAAALGVLKAGGVYVPLDPQQPAERLAGMLADCEAGVLVRDAVCPLPEAPGGVRELRLGPGTALDETSSASLEPACGPADAAYVIYTSGSTGRPKGVVVEHRQAVALMDEMAPRFRRSGDGAWLAQASIGFDMSIPDLFGAMAHGFEVVIAAEPRRAASDPERTPLPELIVRHGVTHMQCTPSQARMLLHDAEGREALGRLRMLLLGGEALPAELARRLLALVPGEVVNGYGPTEATVYTTMHVLDESGDLPDPVPLGRPLRHTDVYVVDERLRPLPPGVPGELLIGGAGVARGYLGRPDLTADRFPADPFRASGSGRAYRSGDRARWRNDGTLEFLGRLDEQVKIRGVRVEPGEVEATMLRHDAVAEVCVTVQQRDDGEPLLAAHVVPVAGAAPDASELRAFAATLLPAAMVPSAVVLVPSLPRSASGKVDRRALSLDDEASTATTVGVEPRNDLELRIAVLWRELLGVEEVGIDEDFFALGGHSLLALRLVQRLGEELDTEVPLSALFARPTIRGFAERIASGTQDRATAAVPLQPRGDRVPVFGICGVHLYYQLARALPAERPFYGLFIPPEREVPDVRALAARYVEAIREQNGDGPVHLTGFCFGGVLAYEVAQQIRRGGGEVASLTLFESYLDRGWRVRPLMAGWELIKMFVREGPRSTLRRLARKLGAEPRRTKPATRDEQALDVPVGQQQSPIYVRATREYEPHIAPWEGRILYFRALEERVSPAYRVDAAGGFADLARGGLELQQVASDHRGILDTESVGEVARVMGEALRRGERALRVRD